MKDKGKIVICSVISAMVIVLAYVLFSNHSSTTSTSIDDVEKEINSSDSTKLKGESCVTQNTKPQYSEDKQQGDKEMMVDMSDYDLPMPSISMLSPDEEQRAVSLFKENRQSWLDVKTVRSRYVLEERVYNSKNNEYEINNWHSGTIEIQVDPLNMPQNNHHAVVKAKITNDYLGWAFVYDDVFNNKDTPNAWPMRNARSDQVTPKVNMISKVLPIKDMFLPIVQAHDLYSSESGKRTIHMKEDEFFKEKGIPVRASSDEETAKLFNGKSQYLFLLGNYEMRYWIDSDNGQLRCMDTKHNQLSNGKVAFRYNDYKKASEGNAQFPTEFEVDYTQKAGLFGSKERKVTYHIKLQGISINEDFKPETFDLPSNSFKLKK